MHHLLLALPVPDPNQVFDKVWSVSPLGAVFGLVAALSMAAAVFQFIELRNERKNHRKDCAEKDKALAEVNIHLQNLITNATTATLGLIQKLEVMQSKADTTELRTDLHGHTKSLRNGIRAVGSELKIPAERMNMD